MAQRFAAWAAGDHDVLIRWWEKDRAALPRRTRRAARSTDREIERALFLIGEGELGPGVALLTSNGLGNLGDDRVVAQSLGQCDGSLIADQSIRERNV